ncbi:MAG: LacI family DNA-binding transcriptional regulator [Eubacteriales bacterium]|nr:LacI family DNA-binding transcriptional regulator [Eubacteriales bacterium]
MGVTLQQIAEMADTTKSTVDKVIHNRPGVSEKKRAQIRQLLKEHGYEANPLAKALNYQKRKMKIAVVLPGVTATPWIRSGMEVVRQDFQSFNIQTEFYDIGPSDAEGQAACLRRLSGENVAGAIIMPIRAEIVADAVRELISRKIPVVIVNSELPVDGSLCYVGQNMQQSGIVAARMMDLFTDGRADIGVISCHNMIGHEQREQSFKNCVSTDYPSFRVTDTKYILETPEDAYAETMELLRQNPETNALFITCGCVEDICRAVRDYRQSFPENNRPAQPAVVCYEKYDEIRDLLRSGEIACTLTGSLSKQGRFSMRVLFEYLVYDRIPDQKAFYFSNKIMIRENC